jgi:hypothetical protein
MSDVPGFVTWITSLRIEVEGPYLEGPSSSTFSKLYCYYIVVFDGEQIYSRAIRRYNDFQWTERALEFEFLGRVIPCTPEKNPLVKAGLANEGFFEDRRQKLEHFVRAIVCLPEVNISKTVFSFMFSSRQEFGLFQEEHSKTLVDVSEKASTSIMGYFETFWAKSDKFKSWYFFVT